MLTVEELTALDADDGLAIDYAAVEGALAKVRVGQDPELDPEQIDRLFGFVELVMASVANVRDAAAPMTVYKAANAALALAECVHEQEHRLRLRSAVLFEIADRPMMGAAIVRDLDAPLILNEYFKRTGPFASLGIELGDEAEHNGVPLARPLLGALGQQAWGLAEYELGVSPSLDLASAAVVQRIALDYGLDLNASDVSAFEVAARSRARLATRSFVSGALLHDLAGGDFPPELWSGQAAAVEGGLLDEAFDAWSFSAPTGTGKTFLSRLLLLATLRAHPDKKALYIVPSRALVRQVTSDLSGTLGDLGIEVLSVTPQLVALEDQEDESLREADVLVLTPEKADLLIRIKAAVMDDIKLVIVDEAHHIENGTRGVLLELYLWRLKALTGGQARFIFMSAVAPNVDVLSDWMGTSPGGVTVTGRATGMRVGVYDFRKTGKPVEGWISYTDGTELRVIEKGADRSQKRGIPQVAAVLGVAGPVLVVAKGKRTAESLARAFVDALPEDAECRLDERAMHSAVMQRLDSRLEREMYSDVPLRELLRAGVAYHHAGLPPRVREAVEDAISKRYIRYVFATTTLAEGVNFPFSSVIVQSLSMREPPSNQAVSWRVVTPRSFWNIAGRAGRAGHDYEGQEVLYGPSLGLDRVNALIDPYLESNPAAIEPVGNALAKGIAGLQQLVAAGSLDLSALDDVELNESVPPATQGFVNLLRVGVAHARATDLEPSATNFFDGTLAARELQDETSRSFAHTVVEQQADVVDRYLKSPGAASTRLLAELGLSMDTLQRLKDYVEGLPSERFDAVLASLPGGHMRVRSLSGFFSAIMARMAEPGGARLGGGLYADLVVEWCSGIPFAAFNGRLEGGRLEDLINLLYTRIQYLLPWALYAVDRFFEDEAASRDREYEGQVRQIAYLADAGVPDFGALRLSHLGLERADATRLSRAHAQDREARETTDVSRGLLRRTRSD